MAPYYQNLAMGSPQGQTSAIQWIVSLSYQNYSNQKVIMTQVVC